MNFLALNKTSWAALFGLIIWASACAGASELKEKIQKELDTNQCLAMQLVKMRVLEENDGVVTLEMSEGPRILRDLFRRGIEVDGAGLADANLKEEGTKALTSVRKTLRIIKHMPGVKEISLTGALNPQLDAAEDFYNDSAQQLAQLYTDKPRTEAMALLRRAAELGYAPAQADLGGAYAFGTNVEPNEKEALFWIRKAADQGDASSLYNLGQMYTQGRGVPQDYQEAIQWYRKGAEQERRLDVQIKSLNALALLLATCPQESLRDGHAAVQYAQKVLALDPTNRKAQETIAIALARCGRFGEAVEQQKKFIQLLENIKGVDDSRKEELLADAHKQLERFQNHQADVVPEPEPANQEPEK